MLQYFRLQNVHNLKKRIILHFKVSITHIQRLEIIVCDKQFSGLKFQVENKAASLYKPITMLEKFPKSL